MKLEIQDTEYRNIYFSYCIISTWITPNFCQGGKKMAFFCKLQYGCWEAISMEYCALLLL